MNKKSSREVKVTCEISAKTCAGLGKVFRKLVLRFPEDMGSFMDSVARGKACDSFSIEKVYKPCHSSRRK